MKEDPLMGFLNSDDEPSLFDEEELIDPAEQAAEVESILQEVRTTLAHISQDKPSDHDLDMDAPGYVGLNIAYKKLEELRKLAASVHQEFMKVSVNAKGNE